MDDGIPDNEIIRRVIQGEQNAYAELVTRYQNYVFTMALKYVPRREDAEELAQDVFVKAYRFLSDFKGETARFSTWLYTITQNTCFSYLRKKRLPIDSLDDDKTRPGMEQLEWQTGEQRMEQQSRQNTVKKAMKLLSRGDASILTLFYNAEQNLDEIAMILRIDPNTAKVRLHRARQRLKEKLEIHWSNEINEMI
jgi:RNA polymerase sigma factor (sigma-70 family)